MNLALNLLNAVWPYVAGGAAITVLTQIIKRAAKLENSKTVLFLFHTLTVATAAVGYLVSNNTLGSGVLLLNWAGLSGIANALYPIVKVADRWLLKVNSALKLVNQVAPKAETVINDAAAQTPPPANF